MWYTLFILVHVYEKKDIFYFQTIDMQTTVCDCNAIK